MLRQILFVQGGGEGTHDEWDSRLVGSLQRALGSAWDIRYPRMPDESDPSYPRWKKAIESELGSLDDGVILIGHSVGATILVNALAEDPPQRALGGIFLLAAPFVGDGGWAADGFEPVADLGAALPEGVPIFLYHGTGDEIVPLPHAELYARAIPQAIVRSLQGRNHQLNDDLAEMANDILSLD